MDTCLDVIGWSEIGYIQTLPVHIKSYSIKLIGYNEIIGKFNLAKNMNFLFDIYEMLLP